MSSIDVIALQRGELLKNREDYIIDLAKLIERDPFRQHQVISNYATVFEKRKALSLEIERGIESKTLKGMG